MTDTPTDVVRKPTPHNGLRHTLASTTYSFAGFRRLLQETAFRQEIATLFVVFGLFAFRGTPAVSYGTQLVLFLVLVSIEALNTAIEVLVDRISPDYAEFARHAKDLGSFAVFCLLAANGVHAAVVLWTA